MDRGLVVIFPGPASYTGEDVVEISCHGGFLSPGLVLDACLAAGARLAEAGEFTRRAFLNGKLDLIQAEAILDLVQGRNRALRAAAVQQLERGLSARIAELRERFLGLEALLVYHIDFPEEDEPPVTLERVLDEAREVARSLELLLATAPEGELLREGALTVLAGEPNTGKSSLFNALVGQERAIVTEIAGTTRDALEAVVSLGGFPFRLVDTAGLRRAGESVERLGIEVARRYLDTADLVLFCVPAGRRLNEAELAFLEGETGTPVVVVRTMADIATGWVGPEATLAAATVRVSAVTGEGLDLVKTVLPGLIFRGLVTPRDDVPVLTRARQIEEVRTALGEVTAFVQALSEGVPASVAATHLQEGKTALEELLGVISPDAVLDRVFRDFCIGK